MEKAISSSVIRAANGNAEKLAYLLDIEQGKGDNFLFDVYLNVNMMLIPEDILGGMEKKYVVGVTTAIF